MYEGVVRLQNVRGVVVAVDAVCRAPTVCTHTYMHKGGPAGNLISELIVPGEFRMHLVLSIMDGHMEGASYSPDRRGVCLSGKAMTV